MRVKLDSLRTQATKISLVGTLPPSATSRQQSLSANAAASGQKSYILDLVAQKFFMPPSGFSTGESSSKPDLNNIDSSPNV
ncbi:hypothetical protein ACH5RR_023704 [Cinchona calisaya]|uniref:Uncharacterized protein n=1 Tax=Cinchona calisaya TaxID=153742 RepID=A0ABD2ZEJ7_9GENT